MSKKYIIIVGILSVSLLGISTEWMYAQKIKSEYISTFGQEGYTILSNYFTKKQEALQNNQLDEVVRIDMSLPQQQKDQRSDFIQFDENINQRETKNNPFRYFVYKYIFAQ